eukprot:UN26190
MSGKNGICHSSYPQSVTGKEIIQNCYNFVPGASYIVYSVVDRDGNGSNPIQLNGLNGLVTITVPGGLTGSITASNPSLQGYTLNWNLSHYASGGLLYWMVVEPSKKLPNGYNK